MEQNFLEKRKNVYMGKNVFVDSQLNMKKNGYCALQSFVIVQCIIQLGKNGTCRLFSYAFSSLDRR